MPRFTALLSNLVELPYLHVYHTGMLTLIFFSFLPSFLSSFLPSLPPPSFPSFLLYPFFLCFFVCFFLSFLFLYFVYLFAHYADYRAHVFGELKFMELPRTFTLYGSWKIAQLVRQHFRDYVRLNLMQFFLIWKKM